MTEAPVFICCSIRTRRTRLLLLTWAVCVLASCDSQKLPESIIRRLPPPTATTGESNFVADWKFRYWEGKVARPRNIASIADLLGDIRWNSTRASGSISYDFATGRYLVWKASTARWFQGAAPYISQLEFRTFDGQRYLTRSCSAHGQTLPDLSEAKADPAAPPFIDGGVSTMETEKDWIGTSSFSIGLAMFPPYVTTLNPWSSRKTLLQILDESRARSGLAGFVEDREGFLNMTVRDPAIQGTILLKVDPKRNLCVVGGEWANGNPIQVYKRLLVDVGESVSPGMSPERFFYPSRLALLNVLDGEATLVEVDHVRRRPSGPSFGYEDAFRETVEDDNNVFDAISADEASSRAALEQFRRYLVQHQLLDGPRPQQADTNRSVR